MGNIEKEGQEEAWRPGGYFSFAIKMTLKSYIGEKLMQMVSVLKTLQFD